MLLGLIRQNVTFKLVQKLVHPEAAGHHFIATSDSVRQVLRSAPRNAPITGEGNHIMPKVIIFGE